MAECSFCKIIQKRPDPALTIFENEDVIGQISEQQKPGNHGHLLVIPKRHVQNIYELPDELSVPLMSTLRLLSRAVKKAFAADGIQIRHNNEPAAGQDVFHLHFHVIPRYQGDHFDTRTYERLPLERRLELARILMDAIGYAGPPEQANGGGNPVERLIERPVPVATRKGARRSDSGTSLGRESRRGGDRYESPRFVELQPRCGSFPRRGCHQERGAGGSCLSSHTFV